MFYFWQANNCRHLNIAIPPELEYLEPSIPFQLCKWGYRRSACGLQGTRPSWAQLGGQPGFQSQCCPSLVSGFGMSYSRDFVSLFLKNTTHPSGLSEAWRPHPEYRRCSTNDGCVSRLSVYSLKSLFCS